MGTVWRPPVYWPSKVGRSPAHACVTVVTGDYSMLCSLTPQPKVLGTASAFVIFTIIRLCAFSRSCIHARCPTAAPSPSDPRCRGVIAHCGGVVQFGDRYARDTRRPYRKHVQRIDEMERIIRLVIQKLYYLRCGALDAVEAELKTLYVFSQKAQVARWRARGVLPQSDGRVPLQFKDWHRSRCLAGQRRRQHRQRVG